MPKVGQWGQLKFEGGLLQECLQVKVHKTTPNQRFTIIQKNSKCYNVYTIYKLVTKIDKLDTKIHKIQQDVSDSHT